MPGTKQTVEIITFSVIYCVQIFGYSDLEYVVISEIELRIKYAKEENPDVLFIVHEFNLI